jgi:hypothetical protein
MSDPVSLWHPLLVRQVLVRPVATIGRTERPDDVFDQLADLFHALAPTLQGHLALPVRSSLCGLPVERCGISRPLISSPGGLLCLMPDGYLAVGRILACLRGSPLHRLGVRPRTVDGSQRPHQYDDADQHQEITRGADYRIRKVHADQRMGADLRA